MPRDAQTRCRLSCVPLPFFPLPIGDNITMLTTADWLLGSNSQSAAGLSTLGDTMEGWHLVLLHFQNESTLCRKPPFFIRKIFDLSLKESIHQQKKISEAVATCVPFIQKRWYLLLLLFYSVSSMVWQQLESFVKEWSGCVVKYCAFFPRFDFLCRSMNSNCVSWVCASLCMYLAIFFFKSVCC